MVNIVEILKQVPVGTKLWSNIFGDVEFNYIESLTANYPISVLDYYRCERFFTEHGYYHKIYEKHGECTLWPSKDHRAWDDEAYKILGIEKKLEAPFGLKPFDKVLIRDSYNDDWSADLFSHVDDDSYACYVCVGNRWKQCIPYNNETKHLLGTEQEPPEKYRQ